MVHAWRGVGKTYFALGAAYAVASGGAFLKWRAERPRKVLYVDGEMPGAAIKERLAAIIASPCGQPQQPHVSVHGCPHGGGMAQPTFEQSTGEPPSAPASRGAEVLPQPIPTASATAAVKSQPTMTPRRRPWSKVVVLEAGRILQA